MTGIIDGILGSDDAGVPLKDFKPTNFTGGGLSTSGKDRITVTTDPNRKGKVNSLANTFTNLSTELGVLKSGFKPGFSNLRSSRLNKLRDIRSRVVGDLSDNLSRRRVAGSSFGQDSLARAESEFSREEDRIIAETTLQELEVTRQLVKEQAQADANSFQTFLTELNLQADVGLQLASQASSLLASNAQAQSLAIQQQNSERSDFIGTLFGTATTLATAK